MKCLNCGNDIAKVLAKRTGGFCRACQYLTIREAVALLKISEATFYRLLREGKFVTRNPTPKRTLITRASVEALLS